MNDTVSTGAKGRLQVTFRDQTNLDRLRENASAFRRDGRAWHRLP